MIDHDRARDLATIALDFELEPAEQAALDGHLASCDPCRTYATSIARDAAALARLPQVDAPERVRRRVIAGRAARGTSARSFAPAAAMVLILIVPLGLAILSRGGFGPGSPGAAQTPPIVTPHSEPAATSAPTKPPDRTTAPEVSPSPSPSAQSSATP